MSWLDYCVCSPVKKHDKVFQEWLEAVRGFKPPPKEIVLATEYDFPESKDYTLLRFSEPYIPERLKGTSGERHYRIGMAREEIKKYIVNKTSYNFVFLLDSDVIVTEYAPLILVGLMSLANASGVCNDFPNKEGYPPVTLGCLMLTRQLLELSTFYPHGYYSEDSVFYSSLMNLYTFGYRFKVVFGRILKVKHYHNGELQESLEPDLVLRELNFKQDIQK
jgi:hypothetical protein